MIKDYLLQHHLAAMQNKRAALLVNQRMMQALLWENHDLILCVSDKGTYLEITEPKGWAPFDLQKLRSSKTIFDHLPPPLITQFLASIQQSIAEDQAQTFEYNIYWNDIEWSRQCHTVMLDEHAAVMIIRDITEKKRAESNKALIDELTQMPNRGYLQRELTKRLTPSASHNVTAACLFINLDRFRLINDALGYVKGDDLIRMLASRLLQVMKERQGLVCRFGGDEFVIVLTHVDCVADVGQFASMLLNRLHEPLPMGQATYSVGASVGISLFPQDGIDGQQLLQNADVAMTVAKQRGRNQYQFYRDALQQSASRKFGLENELRQAVLENQFVLHYQPQYAIETGEVVGMEALVRWQHPDKGLIAPAEFIPLAEETGLIISLGNWVLQEACRQNKVWQLKGYSPVRVAVNISPVQFRATNFIDIVQDTLIATGLNEKWLEIEFTEGLTMEKSGVVIDNMKALFDMGVHMSIDDFGTGYSSLNYLKSFPIQALKIDRSFVGGMTIDQSDSAIIRAIITLGNSLNLSLVAEGIETEAQLELLKEQRCHLAQGFLFSKPLAANEFEDRIFARDK